MFTTVQTKQPKEESFMEKFSPLLILLFLYMVIGLMGKAKKNEAKNSRTTEAARRPQAPAPAPAPKKPAAPAPVSYFETANRDVHRGADGTLHPTEHRHAADFPQSSEGISTEGSDPCHEYMLDDPVLPGCEDTHEDEKPVSKGTIPLSFTKDSVLNAVVMSEVLGRRSPQRNRKKLT